MKTHIGQGTVLLFKGQPEKYVVFDRYGCSSGQEGLMKDAIELHGGNLGYFLLTFFGAMQLSSR